jgi:hypothetical protein
MSTIGATVPTLLDVAKLRDPDGKTARIVELLAQENPVLDDMSWKEGNLVTGDRTTVRTGEPTVMYRRINEGIVRSKSTTAQVDEGAAELAGFSEVDRKLAILSGDIGAFRLSESRAFLSSMSKAATLGIFYGNATTTPQSFTGLTPRYNSLSGTTGENIVEGGGTGSDNASIWLVSWSPETITGIYPKGTKAGLSHNDATTNKATGADGYPVGDTLYDASSNPYLGYRDHYEWNLGLSVKDWRYAVRIANIDMSNQRAFSSAANIIRLMTIARERIPGNMGRLVWYMPRSLKTALRIQTSERSNVWLTQEQVAGKRVLVFDDAPVHGVDQLLETEARVT